MARVIVPETAVAANQKALHSNQAGYEFIDLSAGVGLTPRQTTRSTVSSSTR